MQLIFLLIKRNNRLVEIWKMRCKVSKSLNYIIVITVPYIYYNVNYINKLCNI